MMVIEWKALLTEWFRRKPRNLSRRFIIANNIIKLGKKGDYGLCAQPLDAQTAVYELCRHFLGDDWYCAMPQNTEQVNSEIVFQIEMLYKGDKAAYERLYTKTIKEEEEHR